MNWDLQLAKAAQRAFRSLPSRDRNRIDRALQEMSTDPFSGDVTHLRGGYQGLYRRRVGAWRIIFALRPERRIIIVADIRRRSTTTY